MIIHGIDIKDTKRLLKALLELEEGEKYTIKRLNRYIFIRKTPKQRGFISTQISKIDTEYLR